MAAAPRLRACLSPVSGGVRFYPRDRPGMSGREDVRYLHRFRLGDTYYQSKTRNWLLPQFLSGALILCGVVLTLVGIISLQINKYLHVCDSDDTVNCDSNMANINSVMMPIGVGSTGGGLALILISGFIFVHAFCVIYDDAEHQEDVQLQAAALHFPSLARDTAADCSINEFPQPPRPPPPTPPETPSLEIVPATSSGSLEILPLEMPPRGTPSPPPPSPRPPRSEDSPSTTPKAVLLDRSHSFYDNLNNLGDR